MTPERPGVTAVDGVVADRPGADTHRSLGRRLVSGVLGGGGWSFVVATAGVNGFNFVFHVVISRLLGPAHYGALGALLNFISILAVPLGAVQLAVTQAVVTRGSRGQRSLGSLVVRSSLCGLGAMVAFWLLTPLLGGFLNLGSPTSLVLLGAWIPLAVAGAVLQGALMGELRFVPLAVSTFLGGGALRLVAGAALVLLGFGLDGAVAATVIGQAFTTGVLLVVARRALAPGGDQIHVSLRDAGLSIAALSGYTALTGVDTLLARHFIAAAQSGIYAAASVAGHIAMYLPGALVMVAFPHLASDGGTGQKSRKTLLEALGLVSLLAGFAVVVLAGAPGLVVRALFGSRYVEAASILGILGLASGFLGLIGLLTYFQIARRSLVSLWSWAGVVVVSVLVSLLRGGIGTIAVCTAIVSAAVLVVMALPTLGGLLRSISEEEASRAAPVELPPAEVDLTLVVPFYNPGSRLCSHVAEVVETLRGESVTFEVIAVSDGCTDGSPATLSGLSHVRVIELAENQGKGAALRAGLTEGRGRYLGFIDGDGDIPAAQLKRFVAVICTKAPDVVLGSKLHRDSEVVYPFIRRLYSFGYQQLNRALFALPVRDTQTGVKLIKREALAAVLPRMLEKHFAFDLELLVVAKRLGRANFIELPVRIQERFTSTISPRAVFRMLADTAAIFYRLRVLHYYGSPESAAPARGVATLHRLPAPAESLSGQASDVEPQVAARFADG